MFSLSRAICLATGLLLAHNVVYACSFKAHPVEEHIDGADIIFIAYIREAAEVPDRNKNADPLENPPVRARFRIVDTIKGDPSKLEYLRSGYGWGDCGVPFVVGRRYLILTSSGGQVSIVNGSGDVTHEYEPHRRFIQAIKKYVADGTKIPATSNPFVRPTGKKPPAADKAR